MYGIKGYKNAWVGERNKNVLLGFEWI